MWSAVLSVNRTGWGRPRSLARPAQAVSGCICAALCKTAHKCDLEDGAGHPCRTRVWRFWVSGSRAGAVEASQPAMHAHMVGIGQDTSLPTRVLAWTLLVLTSHRHHPNMCAVQGA